jgi:hypothetical protein
MKEAGESVEMTRLEISCPACGAMRRMEMRQSEFLLPIELFVGNAETYKFEGAAICECGRRVIASLQASAFAESDGAEEEG